MRIATLRKLQQRLPQFFACSFAISLPKTTTSTVFAARIALAMKLACFFKRSPIVVGQVDGVAHGANEVGRHHWLGIDRWLLRLWSRRSAER